VGSGFPRRPARLPAPDLAAFQQLFQGHHRAHQRTSLAGWSKGKWAGNLNMEARIGRAGVKG
jgi:hypothetical protein